MSHVCCGVTWLRSWNIRIGSAQSDNPIRQHKYGYYTWNICTLLQSETLSGSFTYISSCFMSYILLVWNPVADVGWLWAEVCWKCPRTPHEKHAMRFLMIWNAKLFQTLINGHALIILIGILFSPWGCDLGHDPLVALTPLSRTNSSHTVCASHLIRPSPLSSSTSSLERRSAGCSGLVHVRSRAGLACCLPSQRGQEESYCISGFGTNSSGKLFDSLAVCETTARRSVNKVLKTTTAIRTRPKLPNSRCLLDKFLLTFT